MEKLFSRIHRILKDFLSSMIVILASFVCILIFYPTSCGAEFNGPVYDPAFTGWQDVSANPIKPWEADELLRSRTGKDLFSDKSETDDTVEIQVLARSLQNNPLFILDYVRNHIEYVPTFGSANGAAGTLLAGRGNDWDQTSLFIALMRAAGYSADYVIGDVWYDMEILADWTGVDSQINIVINLFARGGIPISPYSPPYPTLIRRVWAQADIGGTTYFFDPSMKTSNRTSGINLQTALNYNQINFMNRVLEGASIESDSIQSFNEANLHEAMADLGMNLVTYIDTQIPFAGMIDILGSDQIQQDETDVYSKTLPGAISIENMTVHTEIPQMYKHTLRIQHEGVDVTLNTCDISGKRVSLFYQHPNNEPQLYVDGTVIATGNPTSSGLYYTMTITVDHPYAAGNGMYADQTSNFTLLSGSAYAVNISLETASQAIGDRMSETLSETLFNETDPLSEPVLGVSLAVTGQSWFVENRAFASILSRISQVITLEHHRVGVTGQEAGYMIDVPMGVTSSISRFGNVEARKANVRANALIGSGFEYSVLEQKQTSEREAVSAVRLLQIANATGQKIFHAHAGNWAAIQPQLLNYDSMTLSFIDAYIQQGFEAVLPEDANIALNAWTGIGFMLIYSDPDTTTLGLQISGGYNGGFLSEEYDLDPWLLEAIEKNIKAAEESWIKNTSGEPVDMATGAFLHESEDMVLGPPEPMGLSFHRYYNSSHHFHDGPLGPGWHHNYEMSLKSISEPGIALGGRTPADSAAAISAAYVLFDLMQDSVDLSKWSAGLQISRWLMTELVDNAVNIRIRERSFMFSRLPDKTYFAPANLGIQLSEHDDGFEVTEPFTNRFEFTSDGQLTAWHDVHGNTMTFEYGISGMLERVMDCFGHELIYTYDQGKLIHVQDFSGRSISFNYTDDLLTEFRDGMNHPYHYTYDAQNRLVSLTKPEGNTVFTNDYNDLGQVDEQYNAYNELMNRFYFNGFRNIEENHEGNQTIDFYDNDGRFIKRRDPAGHDIVMRYNGLGQLIEQTDRLGGVTSFTYHVGTGEIASRTNAEGHTVAFTYEPMNRKKAGITYRTRGTFYNKVRMDYPDNTYETFSYDSQGNLMSKQDRAGKVSSFTYNPQGQILTATNAEDGEVTYTYNADGMVETETDPELGTLAFEYDTCLRNTRIIFPDLSDIESSFDNNSNKLTMTDTRNKTFSFMYDANNNLRTVTNPRDEVSEHIYDLMDREIETIDARGKSTRKSYDPANRVTSITDAADIVTAYGYSVQGWQNQKTVAGGTWSKIHDKEGILKSHITPMDHTTSYETNAMGTITRIINPLDYATDLQPDEMERITETTDAGNRKTFFEFDGWDKLSSITKPVIGTAEYRRNDIGKITGLLDLNHENWLMNYSDNGRLLSSSDPLGNLWANTYNNRGWLETTTYPDTITLTRNYDSEGNLTSMVYSSGLTINNEYDPDLNRLVSTDGIELTYNEVGNITSTVNRDSVAFDAVYDNGNRLETAVYADGLFSVTYHYDEFTGMLDSIGDDLTGTQINLVYDDDLRLTEIQRSNGIQSTFTRDHASRLTHIQHGELGEILYTLDETGQVIHTQLTAPLTPGNALTAEQQLYSYDAAAQIDKPEFSYDSRGQLMEDPDRTLTWDAAGRLTDIDDVHYEYNGLHQPNQRTHGTDVVTMYYNLAIHRSPVMAVRSGDDSDWQTFYIYSPGGILMYMIDAEQGVVSFYHFDGSGNTLFLTDEAGEVTDAFAYSPYGKILAHTGDNLFTFLGAHGVWQEPDDPDIYHTPARWYNASHERFLSRDPASPELTNPQSLNPYQYAFQNPITYIDFSGLNPSEVINKGAMPESERGKPHDEKMSDEALLKMYGIDILLAEGGNIDLGLGNLGGSTVNMTGQGWQGSLSSIFLDTPVGTVETGYVGIFDMSKLALAVSQGVQVGEFSALGCLGGRPGVIAAAAGVKGPGDSGIGTNLKINGRNGNFEFWASQGLQVDKDNRATVNTEVNLRQHTVKTEVKITTFGAETGADAGVYKGSPEVSAKVLGAEVRISLLRPSRINLFGIKPFSIFD